MKVEGLNGREYVWNFSKYHKRKKRGGKSKHHEAVRALLLELFPSERYYEEVTLPGTRTRAGDKLLFADFFVPGLSLVVEVHGRQHYEYVPHFHKTKMGFVNAKRRDREKKEWCELNGFAYAELPYNEEDEWKTLILNSLNS